MSSPATSLSLSQPSRKSASQHIPRLPPHHRSTANFTFYCTTFTCTTILRTPQFFVCLLFIPSSEFLHIAQTIQSLNSDPETCAGTNQTPFGSFRGPSQSLILSSRDRDNTAQKQDLGTDSANKRRNRVDDKTCPLRRQLTWD
jgi:hypothetical protein